METFAFAEILKKRTNAAARHDLSYFRDTNGFEIDFIAEWNETNAIEVKSDRKSDRKLSANIKKYASLRNGVRPKVYYLGDITASISDIEYISWKDW